MLTVTRILTNTPLWVFALLAYLIWQGSLAATEHAADLADADRALGVFSDGLVAAGHGARRGNRAASRVAGGGRLVCLAGAFPSAKTARRGQKERHRDPSGQRIPAGPQHHGVHAAIRRRGGDGHKL